MSRLLPLSLCLALLLVSPLPAQEQDAETEYEGEASLTLLFSNNGEELEDPLQGKFYLYEPGKREDYVTWGHGAKTAVFPAGLYDLVIRYVNGEIREEIVREEVELTEDVIEEIAFEVPVAHLTLGVTSGGRPIPPFSGSYTVFRSGSRRQLARKRPGELVTIRPGNYDIEVVFRDYDGVKTTLLENYYLEGDRQETVELGLPQVELTVTLLEGGRPVSARSGSWRVYLQGQRRGHLAERGSGETLRLESGVYDIGAFHEDAGERSERWRLNLDLRRDTEEQIEMGVARSRLRVNVTRDGAALDQAWFSVYPPGRHDSALASASSGEDVLVEPGTYDIGCFVREEGSRQERWVPRQSVADETDLDIELDAELARLRVLPRVSRRESDNAPFQLNIVLDSSSSMRAQTGGVTRMEQAKRALRELLADLRGSNQGIGLRVFGAAEQGRSCRDSDLLVAPDNLDAGRVLDALEPLQPVGTAPLGYALDQAAEDSRAKRGNILVLITSGADSCGGDACGAATRLLRAGAFDRTYVVGLDVDHDLSRRLDCAGRYYAAADATELASALREIVRDASRWGQGSISVFRPGRSGRWVTGGFLGDRLLLPEGTYDVVIRTRGRTYTWESVEIEGEVQAVAGRRAPR